MMRFTILICLFLLYNNCIAQLLPDIEEWKKIETRILNGEKLSDVRNQLLRIKTSAVANGNEIALTRSLYLIMHIDDRRSEDSLFFQNSSFIDSSISVTRSPQLKGLMYFLKGKRLLYFRDKYFHRQNRHIFKGSDSVAYGRMTQSQLDSVCNLAFDQALQYASYFKDTRLADILWISYDPLLLPFKPGFTDLVYAEKINVFRSPYRLSVSVDAYKWFSLSADDFLSAKSLSADSLLHLGMVFKTFSDWAAYHRPSNPAAFYSIEFMARKFLFDSYMEDSLSSARYESYVESSINSPYSEVRAAAIERMATLWEAKGDRYNSFGEWSQNRAFSPRAGTFDPRFRDYYKKIVRLTDDHQALLDSFQLIKQRIERIKRNFSRPVLDWMMDNAQLPDQPILSFLRYQNVEELHVRIARRISSSEKGKATLYTLYKNSDAFVRDTVYKLPEADDFQKHHTFIKIDGLPAGEYTVFFSSDDLKKDTIPEHFFLETTGVAVINNDHKVFVLDRKTGMPKTGTKVLIEGKSVSVNSSGFVTVKDADDLFRVMDGTHAYLPHLNSPRNDLPNELYSEEDYDTMLEFFEDNITVRFFTDRSIYRPGHAVHYKGIVLVRNPRTGEWRVFNKQNLRKNFFKSLFAEMDRGEMKVYIKDPFGKETDSVTVHPDEFGSFSGSFTLPQNAATGEWDFDTEYFDVDYNNNQTFRVEEYKRPSFELKIEKPSGELRLGNDFSFKVKVRSFAGSKLDNILVDYTITAAGTLPSRGKDSKYEVVELISATGKTDMNGELAITVNDSLRLRNFVFGNDQSWSIDYTVEVEAVDNTGESQEAESKVRLSTRPVSLRVQMPATVDLEKIAPYYISAYSEFGGYMKKMVEVKLMRAKAPAIKKTRDFWPDVDEWIYTKEQLVKWFQGVSFIREKDMPATDEVIFKTALMAGADEKLQLPAELMTAGYYVIEFTSVENGQITGKTIRNLTVFDSGRKLIPQGSNNFSYLPVNSAEPGQTISWYTGNETDTVFSVFHITYFEKHGNKIRVKNEYDTKLSGPGLSEWKYKVPQNVFGNVKVIQQYILNNEFAYNENTIYLPQKKAADVSLAVEKYRTVLKPGDAEVFKVSVRTNDSRVAAQLMTTMYDASLDKLEPHDWKVMLREGYYEPATSWRRYSVSNTGAIKEEGPYYKILSVTGKPVWWLADALWSAQDELTITQSEGYLPGHLSVLNLGGGQALEEVVVVGYGTSRHSSLMGAAAGVTIRGNSSLSEYSKSLIILDGVIYDGDLSKIDQSLITSAAVLRDASATAIYGSRAANGVLLLSTKGPVEIPTSAIEQQPPPARKNFSETAFFYPQLQTDKKGMFTISFTIPESVTEWKWKMLAHTKAGAFAYEERTVFSQLPLMIQPDMPRFLYQGDKLVLKSRISNLDSIAHKGTVKCIIEDVASGKDLSDQLLTSSQHSFEVKAYSNGVSSFSLSIPDTMINPLRIRIIASGDNISDGEEHVIPILSKQILVAQTVALQGDTVIKQPVLPGDAVPYGVSAFIQLKRTASLINALPYLANYSFDCTEQTFNKMLAHLLAIKLMRTDTSLQSAYNFKQKHSAQKVVLLDSLAEGRSESMPWLQLEFAKERQQRELFRLLDTSEAKRKIVSYFDVIKDNQRFDGGMSWFKAGNSDPYISLFLLGALGKAKKDSLPLVGVSVVENNKYTSLVKKLITYSDSLFKTHDSFEITLQWVYARSYWWKDHIPATHLQEKIDSLINQGLLKMKVEANGKMGMLLSAILRIAPKESALYHTAIDKLESLYQQAIVDAKGIRWKTLSGSYDLSYTDEEWLVKIAEAFSESGKYPAVEKGIVQWLQQAKQGNRWSTTKSTGDVVTLMNRLKAFEENPTNKINVKAEAFSMNVTDDMLDGASYDFHRVYGNSFPDKLSVSAGYPAQTRGAVNYYYFTSQPPSGNTGVVFKKEFFKLDKRTDEWEPVSEGQSIRIADKVRVVLTIETSQQLDYVHIEDKRAAGFEPENALSGYEYVKRFSYYKSVTDEGFRFFANTIPAGVSSITYEIVAAKEGVFSTGIGSLECMYQPAVKVYADNRVVRIEPVE